jgi:hypothetical protein
MTGTIPTLPKITAEFFESVDERIESITDKLEMCKMSIFVKNMLKREDDDATKNISYFQKPSKKWNNAHHDVRLNIFETQLKMLKLEKQVYISYNLRKNPDVFPKLLAKYSEALTESLELQSILVGHSEVPEGDYLEYANKAPTQYKYIKILCEIGAECAK